MVVIEASESRRVSQHQWSKSNWLGGKCKCTITWKETFASNNPSSQLRSLQIHLEMRKHAVSFFFSPGSQIREETLSSSTGTKQKFVCLAGLPSCSFMGEPACLLRGGRVLGESLDVMHRSRPALTWEPTLSVVTFKLSIEIHASTNNKCSIEMQDFPSGNVCARLYELGLGLHTGLARLP